LTCSKDTTVQNAGREEEKRKEKSTDWGEYERKKCDICWNENDAIGPREEREKI